MQFKELLGFCAAVEDGRIRTFDDCGNRLFAELRFDGYVAALKGYVDKVVLFGPPKETEVIARYMIRQGANPQAITAEETYVTTYGNAHVMRQYLARQDLKKGEVVGSTSHYHLGRAQFMGEALHDLGITWVPAESFLFAVAQTNQEAERVICKLNSEFGGSDFAHRAVSEIKGIGDLLAGRYRSHKVRA